MAIVVVGGSGKDVGKTALVCAVIGALPEFAWTAVKITGHDYDAPGLGRLEEWGPVIHEESGVGEATDTARYLAAGARRALLATRPGGRVPIDEVRHALSGDRNVIFESNRIVEEIKADVVLGLIGEGEIKPSFQRLLDVADAVLSVGSAIENVPQAMRRFRLESADRLPVELVGWLRERLGALR